MKSKYLILIISAVISAMCLTSCTSSKISTKEQEKSFGPSVENGDVLKKSALEKTDEKTDEKTEIKVAEASKKTGLKKSETKNQSNSTDKSLAQTEDWFKDKNLTELKKKLQNSRIDVLGDSTVICTVNSDPITVGDYRRQFKTEQEQVQASLAMNPNISTNLMHMAQEKGVSLSLKEKEHLADSAKKMQAGGTKGFNKMLSENKMTKAQFRDQVFDVGLAIKMSGKLIEENLLKELVSRKLLTQAAKDNGYSKEALNKYTEVSKSPQYKRLMQVSGISQDDLRDEIITNELCLRQIEKIKKESPITDADISNCYEENRGKFRHGPRIRLSQIFISRGDDVSQTALTMKMKLKKENPKLSEDELNKQVTEIEKKKAQLAKELLERARKGEDFATLANQYSEDLIKFKQKNGGDIGYQEEGKLDKFFADKVDKLPAGGITSEVIVSPYGFHIFKVTAKESKGFYSLNEVKDNLKAIMMQDKGQQLVRDWLANASRNAVIVASPEMKALIASNKLPKREL